jgi:DNA-binding Xre family transcriptional regulator
VRLRLPELFKEKGLTAYEVARRSNGRLAEASIYRLVRRRGEVSMVSAKTIEALCDVLDVGPGDLIEVIRRAAPPRKGTARKGKGSGPGRG